jgi:hypothetical protein
MNLHANRTLQIAMIAVAMIALQSCHTNNLAKYNLSGERAHFRSYVTSSGRTGAQIQTEGMHPAGSLVAQIGSLAAEVETAGKLQRAAQPDSMAHAISDGFAEALRTYLRVAPASELTDSIHYVVETELTNYSLTSNQSGVFASIEAECRILSRANGGVVWENSECTKVPLRQTTGGAVGGAILGTVAGVVNAGSLAQLSEREIAHVLRAAAQEAGREMAEVLREDAAGMGK